MDMMMAHSFDVNRFEQMRREQGVGLGIPFHFAAVTGSTNDDLMAAAKQGAPHGTVHVADLQSRGRGRQGNTWSSPRPAENLLFSVLLRPTFPLAEACSFTLAAGLALRDAVQPRVNCPIGIKWTNDLMADGRKLAGILVESILDGDCLRAIVVGIGLNVHMAELPDEIATIATSLRLLHAKSLDREHLLVDILSALEHRTTLYAKTGVRGIIEELRTCDAIFGKVVRVGDKTGVARGLDDEGALLLETAAGQAPLHLTTGLVELLASAR